MIYDEICLELNKKSAEAVEAWLVEQEFPFEISDEFTLDPPQLGEVRFRFYVLQHEREGIVRAIQDEPFDPRMKLTVRSRDESEWQDVWKRFFHTRILGRFAIVPSWEEAVYQSSMDQIPIHLDPGRAFGTGGHASTRLCLRLMDDALTRASQVLDVGCGCGTLAIAALLANPKARAVAIDIDPEAVEVTRENADRNQVSSRLEASTAPIETLEGSYNLVLANLTGPTLIELASFIGQRVTSLGYLILAGILETEGDKVRGIFSSLGFVCQQQLIEEEWIAFRLQKSR